MAPSSVTYSVGPNNASLTVHTTKAGPGAKLGHNLTFEAKKWSGSITIDEADRAASIIEVTVAATSLVVIDSFGGMKSLSEADRREIGRNINDKVLRTKTYPDITFRSTSIGQLAETFTVSGDLTITGTTRPVSLAVTLGGGGHVTMRTTVAQTAFGIKPYSAMLGTLKVNDQVMIDATLTIPGLSVHE